jgi:hypothetical protein
LQLALWLHYPPVQLLYRSWDFRGNRNSFHTNKRGGWGEVPDVAIEFVGDEGVIGHEAEGIRAEVFDAIVAFFELGEELGHVFRLRRSQYARTLSSNLFWLSLPESENWSMGRSSATRRAG